MAFTVRHPKVLENSANFQCSLMAKPNIYLMPIVQSKLTALMEAYPHLEWCGYLQGGKRVDGGYNINDISIPPHEQVSAGHCLAEPFHKPNDCIGFLHSHHQMGAFHSGQDARTVDVNYEISITIAKRAGMDNIEYSTLVNQETQCGRRILSQGQVILVNTALPLPDGWLSKARRNIDKSLLKLLPTIIQIPVKTLRTTTLVKPVTIDRENNLHDRNGLFAGKNKSIRNPIDGLLYYQDEQGQLFTQQDIDNIIGGKRI